MDNKINMNMQIFLRPKKTKKLKNKSIKIKDMFV